MVLDGNLEMFEVTLLEGDSAKDVGDVFSALGVGDHEEWQSLLSRVDWIAPVVPDAPSLEGFFFPTPTASRSASTPRSPPAT